MVVTYDDISEEGDTIDHGYKKGLMIVVMKKERMWRKSRNSRRKAQRKNINNLSRQQQVDQ